ncbi:ATP-binding cassette sub-family G member 4 [Stomoxys calcitrans]|uniref:ATP-binding cassette sub-family G member 4 n=1 Tax=Stomoxys calcitrans TaxID=35570 RepID=UPI0027E361F4|nr:ATP-binding cassette sub-family G member 4 [Stomoxys calcitrans]
MDSSEIRAETSFIGNGEIFGNISRDKAVNIRFLDITYRVKSGKQTKAILNNISGEFRAGELSAIIGVSGCGKTTLLNLLAGYRIKTTLGDVLVNGKSRDMTEFKQTSRYVLQDDDISPCFTVLETMMFASNFKLESNCSREQREKVIFEILDMFRLREKADTLIANVSGGERKRVCIALELIDSPSVVLLDEPITGLDESSASQCIRILSELAKSGCTVICSLHCPSARLLQMFHKVYAMSQGECIYQGTMEHIVPYLEQFQLECPVTHNPTDFIIDISTNAFGDYQNQMVNEIRHGKVFNWMPALPIVSPHLETDDINRTNGEFLSSPSTLARKKQTSWCLEYRFILNRLMQQLWRDKINLSVITISYILCSIVVGHTYCHVTGNALYSPFVYYLCFIVTTMFLFLGMDPVIAASKYYKFFAVIDISTNAFGDYQNQMVNEIRHGKVFNWMPALPIVSPHLETDDINRTNGEFLSSPSTLARKKQTSWCLEYRFILNRLMQQLWRDKINLSVITISYILCSIVVGHTYCHVTGNALYSPFVYYLCFIVTTMFLFLGMDPVIAAIPRELRYIRREYFNQWYRLSTYFMALVTSQLPIACTLSIVSSIILYVLSGQPMQYWRMSMFAAMVLLISLNSQSFGLMVGSSFNELHSLFVSATIFGAMTIAAHQSVHGEDLSTFHEITLYSGFLRYALEGVLVSLLGLDRPDFPCPPDQWFCPTSKAKSVLKLFGSSKVSYIRSVIVLGSLTLLFVVAAFLIMRHRLNFRQLSRG